MGNLNTNLKSFHFQWILEKVVIGTVLIVRRQSAAQWPCGLQGQRTNIQWGRRPCLNLSGLVDRQCISSKKSFPANTWRSWVCLVYKCSPQARSINRRYRPPPVHNYSLDRAALHISSSLIHTFGFKKWCELKFKLITAMVMVSKWLPKANFVTLHCKSLTGLPHQLAW